MYVYVCVRENLLWFVWRGKKIWEGKPVCVCLVGATGHVAALKLIMHGMRVCVFAAPVCCYVYLYIRVYVQKCNEGIDGLDALWLKLEHVRSSYNESNVQSHHERPLPGGKIHHISRSGEKGVGIELKEKKEKYEAELKKELKKMQRFRVRRRRHK